MSFLNSILGSIGSAEHYSSTLLPGHGSTQLPAKETGAQLGGGNNAPNPKICPPASSRDLAQVKMSRASAPARFNGTSSATKTASSTNAGLNTKVSNGSPMDPPKPPKKGSYKEIMARAQAAAAIKQPPIGSINHKAKERGQLSHRKELKLKRRIARDQKPHAPGHNAAAHSHTNRSGRVPGSSGQSYDQGPARPKPVPRLQPSYKGTMNPKASLQKIVKPKKLNRNEYAATDDELDSMNDESENGEGYSEGSDDMEAGFSDMEQEESAAARAARREDEEEARLEARRKREKEERRMRLEAIAKKAKPPRY